MPSEDHDGTHVPKIRYARRSTRDKFAIENYPRCLFMGQVVEPPASRVCAGASERQRLGDAPTLDVVGYNLPSTFGEEMPRTRTSVHVVQVLVPLAVKVVVGR